MDLEPRWVKNSSYNMVPMRQSRLKEIRYTSYILLIKLKNIKQALNDKAWVEASWRVKSIC